MRARDDRLQLDQNMFFNPPQDDRRARCPLYRPSAIALTQLRVQRAPVHLPHADRARQRLHGHDDNRPPSAAVDGIQVMLLCSVPLRASEPSARAIRELAERAVILSRAPLAEVAETNLRVFYALANGPCASAERGQQPLRSRRARHSHHRCVAQYDPVHSRVRHRRIPRGRLRGAGD